MPRVLLNAAALLLNAALLPDGPARLVSDLNAGRGPTQQMGAQPGVTLGDRIIFASRSGVYMRLWSTDGSPAGTSLLREFLDTFHGMEMAALNGRVIFSAFDARYGRELWQTDGTSAGTALLKEILPGSQGSSPSGFVEHAGSLYFTAYDGIHSSALWKTDGTATGTALALDLDSVVEGGTPGGVVSHRGYLYFFTFDGWTERRHRLWRSDGSLAGTASIGAFFRTAVPGVCAINCDYGPSPLVPHGERLFFLANDGSTGHELWSTDGTSAGTALVKDAFSGPPSGAALVTTPVSAGGVVFFIGRDSSHGQELWTSDGTSDGTHLLLDLTSGAADTYFEGLIATSAGLMFSATGAGTGFALWRSDGTTAGTAFLAPRIRLTGARDLGAQTLVSSDYPPSSGLWATDGTTGGTRRLLETQIPVSLVEPIRGRLLFAAETAGGFGLWDTDGATVSPSPIARLHTGAASSNPTFLTDVSGRLFFGATVGGLFNALHVTDGTEGGTVQMPGVSLHDGGTSGHPVAFQGRLYFLARDAAHGIELWTSDGTEAGTHLVKDIAPGSADSQIFFLSVAGGRLYFRANDGSHGSEPWSSDGTAEGTRLVKDIYPGSQDGSAPFNFVDMGGAVFFSANSSVGRELWRTDGTPEGTLLVKDIHPGSGEGVPFSRILSTGSSLYFSANDGIHGTELWSSDGTETGTRLLVDLRQGPEGSAASPLVTLGERVVFAATPAGFDLWVTDGTEVGTQRLTNSEVTGSSYLQTSFWTASERTLYFWAQDLAGQKWELWRSDGTPAGTVLVRDFLRVQILGSPYNLIAIDDVLLFTFNDPDFGGELWVSDGTRKGTRMLQDISPGIGSSSPNLAVRSGDSVYFTASNEADGRELWTIPVATLMRGSKQLFLRPEVRP